MALTLAQKQTIKTWLLANAVGQTEDAAAALLNAPASPDYWAWRSTLTRAEVYHTVSSAGSTWDWSTYKGQAQGEQGAWAQMFMGDAGPMGNVNFRQGILAIFSGSGAQATQRAHCFAVGRRRASVAETLFVSAVVNPPANTGNNSADARGATTNPDNFGWEGTVSAQDVSDALLS